MVGSPEDRERRSPNVIVIYGYLQGRSQILYNVESHQKQNGVFRDISVTLLFRQQIINALIRLRGYAGLSVPYSWPAPGYTPDLDVDIKLFFTNLLSMLGFVGSSFKHIARVSFSNFVGVQNMLCGTPNAKLRVIRIGDVKN